MPGRKRFKPIGFPDVKFKLDIQYKNGSIKDLFEGIWSTGRYEYKQDRRFLHDAHVYIPAGESKRKQEFLKNRFFDIFHYSLGDEEYKKFEEIVKNAKNPRFVYAEIDNNKYVISSFKINDNTNKRLNEFFKNVFFHVKTTYYFGGRKLIYFFDNIKKIAYIGVPDLFLETKMLDIKYAKRRGIKYDVNRPGELIESQLIKLGINIDKLPEDSVVLDFGAGVGNFTKYLLEKGKRVLAFSSQYLPQHKEKGVKDLIVYGTFSHSNREEIVKKIKNATREKYGKEQVNLIVDYYGPLSYFLNKGNFEDVKYFLDNVLAEKGKAVFNLAITNGADWFSYLNSRNLKPQDLDQYEIIKIVLARELGDNYRVTRKGPLFLIEKIK